MWTMLCCCSRFVFLSFTHQISGFKSHSQRETIYLVWATGFSTADSPANAKCRMFITIYCRRTSSWVELVAWTNATYRENWSVDRIEWNRAQKPFRNLMRRTLNGIESKHVQSKLKCVLRLADVHVCRIRSGYSYRCSIGRRALCHWIAD